MYGMPAKRFDPDIYKDRKNLKINDFAAGFIGSGVIWILLFNVAWYLGPLLVFLLSMAGLKFKFRRRYFIYGALALVFFPFVFWALLMIGYSGRNELK